MKIAVDKNSISAVKKNDNEYIYVFKDETLDELLETGLHCINYLKIGYVDINGASHIYCSGGYDGFYGNSTKDRYVGLNRDPVTWVEKKK